MRTDPTAIPASLCADSSPDLRRRRFLTASLLDAGGLMLSLHWPAMAASAASADTDADAGQMRAAELTAWVLINRSSEVTITVSQAEIGQSISTTLPAILADELGADWDPVRIEPAPFAPAYRNPERPLMFTGNSESTQAFYALMRTTGAAARAMLIQAAAARWNVAAAECVAAASRIRHTPSGRQWTFGELCTDAARLPVPRTPALKAERELKLIGKALAKVDIPSKVDGSAQFGIDVTLAETPRIEVSFIDGGGKLGGIAEVGPVTVPPALANAIHAATGRRLRSMPLSRHGLHFA
ncbi:molybdopterin cofactor-binding domain-containing protein [Massilia sp. PWRC2]|uniref:molybdopterin cofactor-binding domain-containing protein n=1 Tax=Massilia sp. PWRC2 TaxID=2804626 RepID=UPI003CF1762E